MFTLATPAELEARAGDVVIRITNAPCTNKVVLEAIKKEYHEHFKKAEIRSKGAAKAGCFIIDSTGVYLIFEDGNQGYVGHNQFKPVETL